MLIKSKAQFCWFLIMLTVCWLIAFFLSIKLGVSTISIVELFDAFVSHCIPPKTSSSSQTLFILCSIRLPRVLLSGLTGFILSLCGAVMQGLFRTPLADPYLLGILGGSTSGAALMIYLGLGESFFFLPMGSFLGGLLAVSLVSLVATRWTRIPMEPNLLILAGIAFSSLFSAITSCLIYFTPDQKGPQSLIFWLLGSFSRSQWPFVEIIAGLLLLLSPFLFASARGLNLLSLGDVMAQHLGQSPHLLRKILLLLTTLLTATVVASVGPIGFLGILIPHIMRLLVGPDHRRLLAASALGGAVFLTLCDTLSRILFAPAFELPVGIITALLGAPFLLLLVMRRVGSS